MHAPGQGRVAGGPCSIPFDHQSALRRRQAPAARERHGGLKDSRRPASLMPAYIVVNLTAGVRPEEARAIGWEQDVGLDGDLPWSRCCADRAGGDTKDAHVSPALQLAQIAVEALRAWQADQTAMREAAGSRWQDTGRVFTTAAGTPLGLGMSEDVSGRV